MASRQGVKIHQILCPRAVVCCPAVHDSRETSAGEVSCAMMKCIKLQQESQPLWRDSLAPSAWAKWAQPGAIGYRAAGPGQRPIFMNSGHLSSSALLSFPSRSDRELHCAKRLASSCSLITNCGPTSRSTRLQRPLPLDLRSHREQLDRETVRPWSYHRGLRRLMNEQIVSRAIGCPDGVDCCHFKLTGVGPGPRHG